jgi:hypothetical protein
MPNDSFKSSSSGFSANSGGGLGAGSLDDLDLDLPPLASAPAPAADTYQQHDDRQAGEGDGAVAQALPEAPPEEVLDAYAPAPELEEVAIPVPDGGAWEAMLQEEFTRKDKNGDGFLSMKEITIRELLELDVDGNGFISMEEFFGVFIKKTEAAFQKQDLDRDGRLKPAEFYKGAPTPELEAAYQRFCSDPARGLTLDEFRNHLASNRDAKPRR